MSYSDTYEFATNTGDTKFLKFIRNRLVNVHGESPNVDYILTLDDFIDGFSAIIEERDENQERAEDAENELSKLKDRLRDPSNDW